jgi:glycosyltransferase involved in cell wall biosynthesis
LRSPVEKPHRVAFLIDLLGVGGAESQLVDLVNALDPGRILPSVAVLRNGGALVPRLRVPHEELGMRGPLDARIVPVLRSWLRRGRFRAIYTTHAWAAILGALLRNSVGPPSPQRRSVLVCSEHVFRCASASRLLESARRRAVRSADRIIAVGPAQAAWLRGYLPCAPERIEVIPNGVDPDWFARPPDVLGTDVRREFGIGPDEPIVLCVARLSSEKGHPVLLSAIKEVSCHLILLGDGSERPALEARAAELGLTGRVHFAGSRDDTRPFLYAASLVCLASTSEAQGLALVEAMAAGRPVVGTRVGGIPEIIEEGETGLLVPPNEPKLLARAFREILGNPAWFERAARTGPARVRRDLSIHARARRIEDLLDRLVWATCSHDAADGRR